jgi:protoheme IX farnesyltransferase
MPGRRFYLVCLPHQLLNKIVGHNGLQKTTFILLMIARMTTLQQFWQRSSDYLTLLKPRVMSLVVFTALVGTILAPGSIGLINATVAVVAIAVGAGAAGAINMWYDRDIDAIMRRTLHRPLPKERLHPAEALSLGIALSVISVWVLATQVNTISAVLLAITILYYVIIYTVWLKRRTPQNVVIGGVSGALPPVIGWSAVTGSIDPGAIFLFAVIFLWTPPHSWALAIFRQGDYSAASVPMLPVAAGRHATAVQVLIYSILLIPVTLLPLPMGLSGLIYEIAAIALGIGFSIHVWRLFRTLSAPISGDEDAQVARKLFVYSVRYLFLIFLALIADSFVLTAIS